MHDENIDPTILTGRATAIAAINDVFRKSLNKQYGQITVTEAVMSLPEKQLRVLIGKIKAYDFEVSDGDNDPYNEHDFGKIEMFGDDFFWKIDYFDRESMKWLSENPADVSITVRVLTIMYASEY